MYIARGEAEKALAGFTLREGWPGKPKSAKFETYHSPFNEENGRRIIRATRELKEQPRSVILVGDLNNPLFFDEFGILYGFGNPVGDLGAYVNHVFQSFNPADYKGKDAAGILLDILNGQQAATEYM